MKSTETREKDIAISNTGSKSLEFSNFSTSCDCTFVQFQKDGDTSERYSMHTSSKKISILNPGETGMIKVIYQPSIMPVTGIINRTAFFTTNDPANSYITVEFTADVE